MTARWNGPTVMLRGNAASAGGRTPALSQEARCRWDARDIPGETAAIRMASSELDLAHVTTASQAPNDVTAPAGALTSAQKRVLAYAKSLAPSRAK